MSDEAIEALRARVRQGDEAARPALQRALVRAGRPVTEAWEGLGVTLIAGEGLDRSPPPPVAEGLAHDLSVLDLRALIAWAPTTRSVIHAVTLAEYDPPQGPFLVVAAQEDEVPARRRVGIASAPRLLLDLVDRRPDEAWDLTGRRGPWDFTWAWLQRALAFNIPPERLLDVVRALLERLEAPLPPRLGGSTRPRQDRVGRDSQVTRWQHGGLQVDLVETRGIDDPFGGPFSQDECEATIAGLPGGGHLLLEGSAWGGALASYELHAPEERLQTLLDAWQAAVDEVAAREVRWARQGPEVWLERAREVSLVPGAPGVDVLDLSSHGLPALHVGPPVDGVRWSVAVSGCLADAPSPGPYLEPAGPLPLELSRLDLFAERAGAPLRDFTADLVEELTGGQRPPGRELRHGSYALGPWYVSTRSGSFGAFHVRLQHERGARPAALACLENSRLRVTFVGEAAQVRERGESLRAWIPRAGWRVVEP